MLRINQIKVSAFCNSEECEEIIYKKVASKLNIAVDRIDDLRIVRRSLDARKKNDINYVYCVDVSVKGENKLKIRDKDINRIEIKEYEFEYSNWGVKSRPIIVGFGPAGMFCAYMLAKAGFKPIVYERGKNVEDRTADVEEFWKTGILKPESNVQFGEGGAGTFSDGKLNTLVKDKFGRNKEVLRTFVEFGAPESILYDNKPHIGTDILKNVVINMRNKILEMGAEIYYESLVSDICIENNRIKSIVVNNKTIDCEYVVLAVGHSARDTFYMLRDRKVLMSQKAFAVGFRVMHPQEIIDSNQYGAENLNNGLPVADYKLTHTSSNGRGVYSFCMCPGGYVVNASSEEGYLAVNGMSYHDRNSGVANSAIVVQVTPEDYPGDDVLSGVVFQRKLEKQAYELGKGKIPVQRYGDYRHLVDDTYDSAGVLEMKALCKGEYNYADLTTILPKECNRSFVEGMERFGHIIEGFNDGNMIMAGVESRTSSPVRIERNEEGISSVSGLYPCGEGAGYAGGITSAAMDGIYIAEKVAASLCKGEIGD